MAVAKGATMSKLIMWNMLTVDGFFEGAKVGSWTGTNHSGVMNWSVSRWTSYRLLTCFCSAA